jgi:hypothetical protein
VELDGQTGLASAEAAAQSLGYVSANDNDSNNVDNPLLTNAGYAPLVAGAFDGTEASFAAVYTEARRKVGDELEFPTFAGKRIDISDWHKLYVEVLKLGGHQAVTNGKLWAKVFSKLKLPLELTSASNGLRKHYVTFLASFEEEEASRLVVASGSVPSASGAPCTGHELDGPEARMDVLAATAAAAAAADTAPDTVAAHEAFEEDEDVTIAADAKMMTTMRQTVVVLLPVTCHQVVRFGRVPTGTVLPPKPPLLRPLAAAAQLEARKPLRQRPLLEVVFRVESCQARRRHPSQSLCILEYSPR